MRSRDNESDADDTDAEADESYLASRRAKRKSQQQRNVMLLGAVVVVGLAVIGAGAIAVWAFKSSGVAGAVISSKSEIWTHEELVGHLEANGFKLTRTNFPKTTFGGKTKVEYNSECGEVSISKYETSSQADNAGNVEGYMYTWGSFVIVSSPECISRIKSILKSTR